MRRILRSGLHELIHRWPVVLFLYAALMAPTLIFGAVAWARLQVALDRSLAGRTLLKDVDLNVFVDLFVHRKDAIVGIGIAAVLLIAGSMMVWIWLQASMIAALSDDESLGDAMRRGAEVFGLCFRLWLITIVVNLAIVACFYFLGRAVLWWTAESTAEMTRYWVIGGCGLAAALLLLLSMVVHDHARIRGVSTDVDALAAYRWGLRFCLHDERRTVLLAIVALGAGLVLWSLYQGAARLVSVTSAPGVVTSLLWGQVLIVARVSGRFWYFAAANELQVSASSDWDEGVVTAASDRQSGEP